MISGTVRHRQRIAWCSVALALVLSTAGCGPVDGDTSRDSTLGYADAACPAEISAVIVADLSCGRLIVPERRGQTESRRTIELLVARVTPPTPSDKEPMFVAGTELGSNVDYGGIAPLAQRVDRDVIFLAARGTGYAKPSLQCPEVDALGDADLANPINDPTTRQAYLREVGACHQRLTREGIDVSAYNLAEMAADAEDLRRALGIRTWNVITYGTASRIALEMLRADPSRIRTVTLDSPELPGTDPRLLAVDATRDAIAAVLTACAEDADCVKDYPDVRQSFTKALLSVQAEPLDLALANQPPDGRSVIVHVDPGMLVRLLRQMLSEGAGLRHPRAVPRVLDAVSDRRTAELTEIATAFVGDSAYCNGYQTRCVPSLRRAPGVLFTTLCHDIAPFSDPTQPSQHARNQLGFDLAYGQSPYLEVCRHWPVSTSEPALGTPVRSDVPVLVVIGIFGPYVRPVQARASLGGLQHLALVVSPTDGHNVVPKTDCMLKIRKAWLNRPSASPTGSECFANAQIAWERPAD